MEEMELLLLADPSTEVVNGYLKKEIVLFKKGAVTVGIMILIPTRTETIEIINIAVSKRARKRIWEIFTWVCYRLC